jgi:hypothetical protein
MALLRLFWVSQIGEESKDPKGEEEGLSDITYIRVINPR